MRSSAGHPFPWDRARDGGLMFVGGIALAVVAVAGRARFLAKAPTESVWPSVAGWAAALLVLIGLVLVIQGVAALSELPVIGPPLRSTLSYAVLVLLACALIGPFVWMVIVSLRPPKSPIPPLKEVIPYAAVVDEKGAPVMVMSPEGKLVPKTRLDLHWENYDTVLNSPTLPVGRFFLNSLVVTSSVLVLQLFITSLAAYGLSRLRWRGREAVFWLFLVSMMFAGPVTQIPVYMLLRSLGWLDTYLALIVPGISSAFSVFLLRQFFLQIPFELDEAARIDGASDFVIYSRIIVPLSKAALATAGAFTFFGVWTDFFGPLIYTNSTEMRTLEVGLSIFKNSYGGSNWPLQMSAALIVMAPLLIVFLFVQRYFVKGIMLGSIK